MMARNQISMPTEIQRRARRRAAEMGLSFSEYVRRLVLDDVAEPSRATDVSEIFDLGDSGGGDVGREKDRMLGQAIAARKLAPRRPRARSGR